MNIFRKGDTVGIFQFESEGMKRFLIDLKPNNFLDICSAIALYRPGPAASIPSFVKRINKEEKVTYINESLKDILESTYGIIIYQEQIMKIGYIMANYTLGEADILRRAKAKKIRFIKARRRKVSFLIPINNGYTKRKVKRSI